MKSRSPPRAAALAWTFAALALAVARVRAQTGEWKDPVTGETRQISNTRDHTIQIAYLEDIKSLNSSLEFDMGSFPYGRDYYRIDQLTHLQLATPYFGVQWDYKPQPDLDLQLQLSNIVPYTFDVIEYNYAGPRNISPLVSIQDEHTHSFPRIFLQLRKTF